MASLISRPKGHKWIQYRKGGKRHTLRLGEAGDLFALEALKHVESILTSQETGELLQRPTMRWIAECPPIIRQRLAALGLVAETSRTGSLGELLEYCLQQYASNKPNTQRNMRRAADALLEYFGSGRSIDTITRGDAEDFRRGLRRDGLAETTLSEICRKAKRLFEMAVDHDWLVKNPFKGMKGFTRTNDERQFFVDRKTIDRLLKRCEPEWQLIIALVRFGGLRCPSEVMALRWEWVDFEDNRFSVFAPKTEHIEGKAFRDVPLFPDLRPHFEAAWDRAEEGAEFVVNRSRTCSNRAIDSAMRKRLDRAGLNPWPRLFTNLRSSRETELVEEFPVHVVTAWLGNSITIAKAHYLQVTESHFERAVATPSKSSKRPKAKQKAKQ